MIRVNIYEAKSQLSRHLARVEQEGETIVICRRNIPIAEIRPLPQRRHSPRETGFLAGSFEVPESFFEPLPEEILRTFEGEEPEIESGS